VEKAVWAPLGVKWDAFVKFCKKTLFDFEEVLNQARQMSRTRYPRSHDKNTWWSCRSISGMKGNYTFWRCCTSTSYNSYRACYPAKVRKTHQTTGIQYGTKPSHYSLSSQSNLITVFSRHNRGYV
jgi:hypothetical protein